MFAKICAVLLFAAGNSAWAAEADCPPGAVANQGNLGETTATWCELAADRSLLHGPYRARHPSGTVGTEENYRHGKASGKAAYRWGSGHRQAEGNYKDNVRDGWWTFWDKNGAPAGRVRYQDGAAVSGQPPRWAADWDGTPMAQRPSRQE